MQLEGELSDPAKEEAICLKAEVEFQMAIRRFNASPIFAITTEIEEQIKGQYGPDHVLKSSIDIRKERYILPLVSELIKIESDLRSKHRVPFSQARIAVIRDKIRAVVEQTWYVIVVAAREEAISHVLRHAGRLDEYKETELSKRRDDLLATGPHELFVNVDERLQEALADSVLLAD